MTLSVEAPATLSSPPDLMIDPGRSGDRAAHSLREVYRQEHEKLRDSLLTLAYALDGGDQPHSLSLLLELGVWLRPRLQYQEEALFPALTATVGGQCIEHRLADHDRLIEILNLLGELLSTSSLTKQDAVESATLIRSIIPQITESVGLGIMADLLPEQTAREILRARAAALRARIGFRNWSMRERQRQLSR